MSLPTASEIGSATSARPPFNQPQTSTLNPHQGEFRLLGLDLLWPSPTNPRKTFDGPELDELAADIRTRGILQPLVVRPSLLPALNGSLLTFEIVAGERRYRAAKMAGLSHVPVMVREMSDIEALEVQVVENQQRKDVSPLEESRGYVQLLDAMLSVNPKAKRPDLVAEVARRIGKSVRYVYARMKLAELEAPVLKALEEGKITASHADELVRLDSKHQVEMLEEIDESQERGEIISVRELKDRIAEIFVDLADAPWDLDDARLLPPAGSCSACPQNSKNDPAYVGKDALCADEACYTKKRDAFVQIRIGEARKLGAKEVLKLAGDYTAPRDALHPPLWKDQKVKAASCNHAQPGVVVSGKKTGEIVHLCRNEKCEVHRASQPKGKEAKYSAEDQKRAEERKKRTAGNIAVLLAVLPKVQGFTATEIDLIAPELVSRRLAGADEAAALTGFFGKTMVSDSWNQWDGLRIFWRKNRGSLTVQQKAQLLVAGVLDDDERLDDAAKIYKLDSEAIRAAAIKALETPPAKPPVNPPAKKADESKGAKAQTSAKAASKAPAKPASKKAAKQLPDPPLCDICKRRAVDYHCEAHNVLACNECMVERHYAPATCAGIRELRPAAALTGFFGAAAIKALEADESKGAKAQTSAKAASKAPAKPASKKAAKKGGRK